MVKRGRGLIFDAYQSRDLQYRFLSTSRVPRLTVDKPMPVEGQHKAILSPSLDIGCPMKVPGVWQSCAYEI